MNQAETEHATNTKRYAPARRHVRLRCEGWVAEKGIRVDTGGARAERTRRFGRRVLEEELELQLQLDADKLLCVEVEEAREHRTSLRLRHTERRRHLHAELVCVNAEVVAGGV